MKTALVRFALVALLLIAASAQAQNIYYVDVANNTGYVIHYLHVSPANTQSWEEDVLGNDVLMNGDTFRVNLNGYSSPMFDIRLTDEDGDTYTFMGVDVSSHNLNVTLANLDIE